MSHQLESDLGTHSFEVLSETPLQVQLDGTVYDVEFVERGPLSLVLINGTPVELCARGGRASMGSLSAKLVETLGESAGGVSGAERVVAPMPGRVVAIKCQVGDAVTQGQPLLVLEAMKMENELLAPAAGTISAILSNPGDAIEAGVALIELDPPEPQTEA